MSPRVAQSEITKNASLENNSESNGDSVELLRRILSRQQQRPVNYDEAQEVGNSLIDFYQLLAEEVSGGPAY